MSAVLIVGASRGIGLETVKVALKAGHSVRAMARSASAIRLRDPNLEQLDGDALVAKRRVNRHVEILCNRVRARDRRITAADAKGPKAPPQHASASQQRPTLLSTKAASLHAASIVFMGALAGLHRRQTNGV